MSLVPTACPPGQQRGAEHQTGQGVAGIVGQSRAECPWGAMDGWTDG